MEAKEKQKIWKCMKSCKCGRDGDESREDEREREERERCRRKRKRRGRKKGTRE